MLILAAFCFLPPRPNVDNFWYICNNATFHLHIYPYPPVHQRSRLYLPAKCISLCQSFLHVLGELCCFYSSGSVAPLNLPSLKLQRGLHWISRETYAHPLQTEHAQGPSILSVTAWICNLESINLRTCMVIATNITSGLCGVLSKRTRLLI